MKNVTMAEPVSIVVPNDGAPSGVVQYLKLHSEMHNTIADALIGASQTCASGIELDKPVSLHTSTTP